MTFIWIQIVARISKSCSISGGSKLRMFTQGLPFQQLPRYSHTSWMSGGWGGVLFLWSCQRLAQRSHMDPTGSTSEVERQPFAPLWAQRESHIPFYPEILVISGETCSLASPRMPDEDYSANSQVRSPSGEGGWVRPQPRPVETPYFIFLRFSSVCPLRVAALVLGTPRRSCPGDAGWPAQAQGCGAGSGVRVASGLTVSPSRVCR